ncbi:MAG: alpha-glucan family phosphorylase [Flammeovirgaceae bacterium]|nr:alpha-glucan family phosphorylase [Flammeovirgaceae bacterium]
MKKNKTAGNSKKKTNKKPKVAYFCMEYGLDTSLRTYAGGLGILAGDYLKGAKDHKYPIVGIGIKWKQGYTDQLIDKKGQPYDSYHNYNYDCFEETGVKVSVDIRNIKVVCKVWKVTKFGNAPIYMLDTDIPENSDNWITGQLYGWFGEERIAQEMVLGIGGVRALRKLGIKPEVYHFNEGHALFAGFELIREKMEKGLSLKEAKEATKKQVVFTTHTPVVQGNESHPIDKLMYMGANLNFTAKQLEKLGGSPFNMTVGALRLSKKSNAVAGLHNKTANKMWKDVKNRSEIVGITNCIHLPTWVDPEMIESVENSEKLWNNHQKNKKNLIAFVKERTGITLKEDVLLIGFSRRAVPYKRSNLIFTNKEIIEPLLKENKLQLIFSGKAHPLDDTGKAIVANLVEMSEKYKGAVIFLENYDMTIGAHLTRGSDVWLNNPRRPLEASGTSGMKAAMNGVLNFSILDGWWPEACEHGKNGWQFGDGFEGKSEKKQDKHDLDALYKTLLDEVIPTYYDNRKKWVKMMKRSIISTKDEFAVNRMLKDYYKKLYLA